MDPPYGAAPVGVRGTGGAIAQCGGSGALGVSARTVSFDNIVFCCICFGLQLFLPVWFLWGRKCQTSSEQVALTKRRENVELVAFVEASRYDESTMRMAVQQAPEEAAVSSDEPPASLHMRLRTLLDEDSIVETGPAKMFQTENVWAALLSVRREGGSSLRARRSLRCRGFNVQRPKWSPRPS